MPLRTSLSVLEDASALADATSILIIGRAAQLRSPKVRALTGLATETLDAMLDALEPGDWGASTRAWVGPRSVQLAVLPEACARTNSPSRAWAIPAQARLISGAKKGVIVAALADAEHAAATLLACARAFPLFDATSGEEKRSEVGMLALGPDGEVLPLAQLQVAVDGVRMAARLVDTPTNTLHTEAFVDEARAVAARRGASIRVIEGEEIHREGLGGLWGVGKAATHKPALVILEHAPQGATSTWAWVGKGIVYDTGGLSIKGKTNMPGMKGDMGGAAAVLGAFDAAAAANVDKRVLAVLCLAENSVGPDSTRPDDILRMHSGKTVEVNNTDAEGRLVLSDGLSWVIRNHRPDKVVDLATLTGAALVATGKVHAGIYCNDDALERAAVDAGKRIGEPVFPLLYAPELLRKEFKSPVADMKNSVRDRGNAQSSCAGQFIANHLPEDCPPWLHVDLAGPAWDADDRGTGYGVGLLLELMSG
ncbi:MAG: leucyl aminopeptidase family protein [Alphaproteobacteria bacterium]|nr:leucyl aminopeptidase family protein [Alphaproteobacteria bacterium]